MGNSFDTFDTLTMIALLYDNPEKVAVGVGLDEYEESSVSIEHYDDVDYTMSKALVWNTGELFAINSTTMKHRWEIR